VARTPIAGGRPIDRAVATRDERVVEHSSGSPSLALSFMPAAVAGGLAILAVVRGWRGSDLPAHLFRVHIIERDGFEIWNNYWYGGHHTLGYGFAFPVLGAVFGIWTVAVASAALSAFAVDRLVIAATGRRNGGWASLWFAVGTLTNVAIGRLPFALGLTVGLIAILAARHRSILPAALAAAAAAAASPVASAFLAVIFTAWAIVEPGQRRFFAGLASASIAPLVLIALLYPQGGTFPFRWPTVLWTVVVCTLVRLLVPAEQRLVRMTAGVYGLAAAMAFVVPNPLGSNITRLGMYAAGPVLLTVVPVRRWAMASLVPLLLWWQWSPAFDAMARAGGDPSTAEAYYAPLRGFLHSVDAGTGRVEVVPTWRHWEVAYVAVDIPIARGWKRQLDRRFHPLFYEPGLTADDYHTWLLENGVEYVALPDVALDASGKEEEALLEGDLSFLRPVFASDHWRVWEVIDSPGLVDGPAELIDVDTETLRLRVLERGDVVVRVHASAFWASDPASCIEPTADGWMVLRDVQPGVVDVFLDETDLLRLDDPCASAPQGAP